MATTTLRNHHRLSTSHIHRFIRHRLHTTTASIPTTTTTDDTTPPPILPLDDTKSLFSSIPTSKLLKSAAVLHAVAVEPAMDFGSWVMTSRLMDVGFTRKVVLGVVRRTFYDHFVAGSGVEETGRTVERLWELDGLKGMLDYGLEHAGDNESCDRNQREIVKTVESVKSLPSHSVSFVVVKITAICPIPLLRRVSDLLRWEYKEKSFHLPWKLDTLPIFNDSSPLYHTTKRPDHLTLEEEQDLQLAHQRLKDICEKCIEANVPLLVDAEDTSIQPGIDYFAYSAAIMHNKDVKPIVFTTIQAYLKDARERLLQAKRAADKMGFPMGFKLVRGAYMSSEIQLASSLGLESPIHNGIQQTHDCYNDCASFMLEEVSNGPGAVVLATHNVESGKLAAKKAIDLGIWKRNGKLQFAQLYGMSDALSYGLRNAGFDVSKYLAFGPVEQIIPFLLRRAEENKGLLSSSTLDRQLIMKELRRRTKVAVLGS